MGFFVCFWPSGEARATLVPRTRKETTPPAAEALSLPRWTAGENPWTVFHFVFYLFWTFGIAFWGERIGFNDLVNFFLTA